MIELGGEGCLQPVVELAQAVGVDAFGVLVEQPLEVWLGGFAAVVLDIEQGAAEAL